MRQPATTGPDDTDASSEAQAARRVTLDLPAALYDAVVRLAHQRGCSTDAALIELVSRAVDAGGAEVALRPGLHPVSARAGLPGTASAAPSAWRAHAAWRAEAPPSADGAARPHEWAEDLVPTLPLRFQKYIAELLFDDERILFVLYRPPFKLGGRIPGRSQRELEGVFVITDRMVLMMEDAIPPGPMFVAWGYNAWITAIERVASAETETAVHHCAVRLTCGAAHGWETHTIRFPLEERAELPDAVALLNRYARAGAALPARIYAEDVPAWEPSDRRYARLRIAGRGVDEVEEQDIAVAVAEAGPSRVQLQPERLDIIDAGISRQIGPAAVSSIRIWRALTGCALDVCVPEGRSVRTHTAVFQYPQSMPFMRVAARLRHYMGRPFSSDA